MSLKKVFEARGDAYTISADAAPVSLVKLPDGNFVRVTWTPATDPQEGFHVDMLSPAGDFVTFEYEGTQLAIYECFYTFPFVLSPDSKEVISLKWTKESDVFQIVAKKCKRRNILECVKDGLLILPFAHHVVFAEYYQHTVE